MKSEPKIMKASELFRSDSGVFEVRVIDQQMHGGYGLYFELYRPGDNKVLSIVDFNVIEIDAYTTIPVSLQLTKDATGVLMQDLWRIGIRPTEDHGTNEIAALNRHLQDMRAIAANRLKITLP